MNKLKDLVESVLRDKPETRDSLKLLLLEVWKLQGLELTEKQITAFLRCADPITLRRRAQEVQNDDWKYRPSDPISRQRSFLSTGAQLKRYGTS